MSSSSCPGCKIYSSGLYDHTFEPQRCRLIRPTDIFPASSYMDNQNTYGTPASGNQYQQTITQQSLAPAPVMPSQFEPNRARPFGGLAPPAPNQEVRQELWTHARQDSGASSSVPGDHNMQANPPMQWYQQSSASQNPTTVQPNTTAQTDLWPGNSAGVPSVTTNVGDMRYMNGQAYRWDGSAWQCVGDQLRKLSKS